MCPTQINILSSAPSPTANQAQSEQESSKSSSSFYFNKSKKEKNKTKINYEEYHDELSQSINYFMTTQAQSDIWWKIICWVWWWQCKVMKVWNSEEGFPKKDFFFKKKRSDLTLKKLFQIIQKVFKLNGDISFVMLFILLQRIDTNILSNVYLFLLLLDFWICIYPL